MAQRAHLDRASEQLEFAERLPPGKQGVELGRLEILHSLASHADHVMMRAGVAVVARGLMQRRDFARLADVATGQFGARMRVSLVNDGPVTFWLEVPPGRE